MNVFELFASLSLKADSFFSGLASAGQALSSFGGEIENVFGAIQTIDNIITKPFDTVVSVIAEGLSELAEKGTEFVQSFMQEGMSFDAAMGQVGATMQTTQEDLDAMTISTENFSGTLRDFAKKLGAETAFSSTQAAEGLNVLAQAGLNVEEQVESLPTVLDLAAAGNIELGTSATYVTAAVKGFQDEMSNAQYYSDLIAKGATLANTSVNMLGEAFSGSSATAKTYNQSAKSLEVSLLRLAEQNVVGSEATTALNRVMTDLFTATDEAKEVLDSLGVVMYDTTTHEARDLNDIVDDLSKALSGYNDEQRLAYESTIFSTWGMKAFDKMASTSTEKMELFNAELERASDGEGAAAGQAEIQLSTLQGQLKLLESAYSGIQTNLFDKILPLSKDFVKTLSDGLGEVAGDIGEGNFGKAFSDLGETAVKLINKGVDTILNSGDTVTEFVDGFLTFIEKVANNLLDSGSVVLPELLDFVLDIGDKVITGMVDFLSDEENLEKIRGTINLLLIKLQTFLDEHEDDLYTIFDTIYDVGIGFVEQIFTIKRKTTSDILWRKIQEIFQPVGDAIWHWIDKWIVHFGDTWESLFQPVGDKIGSWLSLQKRRFDKWVDKEFKKPFKKIKNFFSTWWDTIVTFWSDKLLGIKSWIDESKELITTAFENIDLSEIGKNIIDGLWNGITNKKDWLIEKIGGFTDSVTNAFKDFFGIQSPSKVMRDKVGKFLAEGIGVGFTKEMDKVTEDMQKALPTSFDVNTDIVSRSVPTQSNFGGNTFELHIENFYNNRQDDVQKLGRALYSEIFREKAAMI